MITETTELLNKFGIRDGVLRNFASQEPKNDKALNDAINSAISRRENEIADLNKVKLSGTIVYVVIWQDRHIDTDVFPFADKEKAIAEAKKITSSNCRDGEDYTVEEIEGYVFCAAYGSESDHVRVVEKVIDKEI